MELNHPPSRLSSARSPLSYQPPVAFCSATKGRTRPLSDAERASPVEAQ